MYSVTIPSRIYGLSVLCWSLRAALISVTISHLAMNKSSKDPGNHLGRNHRMVLVTSHNLIYPLSFFILLVITPIL